MSTSSSSSQAGSSAPSTQAPSELASSDHQNNADPLPPPSQYDLATLLQPNHSTGFAYPADGAFFHEVFHSTAGPPPINFLDSILNPIELGHNSEFIVSGGSFLRRSAQTSTMAPSNLHNERPARLANGYVDLTSTADEPTALRRRRESPTPGPAYKRQRRNKGTAAEDEQSQTPEAPVESINLSDECRGMHDVLQRQREHATKAQQKPEEKATTFNTFTCVICMDTPTDLTATACGHLFCHTCLMEALIAGEARAAPGEPKRSQCPVCRKIISRTKSSDVIPLLLKKGLATQPRKGNSAAAALQRHDAPRPWPPQPRPYKPTRKITDKWWRELYLP